MLNRWLVVALGGLAVITPACSGPQQPPTMVASADTADQVVFGLAHSLTADGVLRARVEADSAYFFEATQTAELFQVTVTFFSSTGEETSTITADEGTYWWRTAGMEGRGNVVGVSPNGRHLTTSVLEYDPISDRLIGNEPFVFTAPGRRLEGDAFASNPDFTSVTATRPRGTMGEVDLGNR